MSNKYSGCIKQGIEEPLSSIQYHGDMPFLERILLANDALFPRLDYHIAAHLIDLPEGEETPAYSEPHKHNVPEINILLSQEREKLMYEITLGDEKYTVESPATILIPAGVDHTARAISGKGIFLCIVNKGKYTESFEK